MGLLKVWHKNKTFNHAFTVQEIAKRGGGGRARELAVISDSERGVESDRAGSGWRMLSGQHSLETHTPAPQLIIHTVRSGEKKGCSLCSGKRVTTKVLSPLLFVFDSAGKLVCEPVKSSAVCRLSLPLDGVHNQQKLPQFESEQLRCYAVPDAEPACWCGVRNFAKIL